LQVKRYDRQKEQYLSRLYVNQLYTNAILEWCLMKPLLNGHLTGLDSLG